MSLTERISEPIAPPWLEATPDPAPSPEPEPVSAPLPVPPGPAAAEAVTAEPAATPAPLPAPGPTATTTGADELTVGRPVRRPPRSGWRRWAHTATAGLWNPGESAADRAHRDLLDRVGRPVRGDFRIALLSLKGGVGKTTTTIGLGSTFASLRGDRVIAVDANPDLGTLAQRVPAQTDSTARDLLDDRDVRRYSDVRAHTSQAPSRLEVLASERDPAVSVAFDEADYRAVLELLSSYYNIVLTDCGTGLMHSAMVGTLATADALVLVTSPAVDGVRSAVATLDWLEHHGHAEAAARAVVVVNGSRRRGGVDPEQLAAVFGPRCRAVITVPHDRHLAEGGEIDLELVGRRARRAYLELAATVAEEFSAPRSAVTATCG